MRCIAPAAFLLLVAPACPALICSLQRGSQHCELPEVFYSAAHDPSVSTPCCPRPSHLCPGGVACVGTACAPPDESVPCTTASPPDLPNIVLYVADDQGYCHFGFMGPECRSSGTGTFLPVPATPELDRLARRPQNQGKGRVFVVAHASAPFSFPARDTILTGLLRKDSVDPNVHRRFIPQLLAEPGAVPYCSFGARGKLGRTSERDIGYHVYQKFTRKVAVSAKSPGVRQRDSQRRRGMRRGEPRRRDLRHDPRRL